MPKTEIEKLIELQEACLVGGKLSGLTPDLQIEFCQTNKRIGDLAYQLHQKTNTPATALDSAYYFSLAVEYGRCDINVNSPVKSTDSKVAVDIDLITSSIKSLEDGEELFRQGICYFMGIGNCSQNHSLAFQLFETAAEQGSMQARHYLGCMYRNGFGVAEDDATANICFLLAAEQGDRNAQLELGRAYYNGFGVAQDYAKANKWFLLAAEQGHTHAQNYLGFMYQHALGVVKDYAKANKWFRLAAEQGNRDAQNNLGYMYQYGMGVAKDYRKALEWFRLAGEQGHKIAQFNIACMYADGLGTPKNDQVATRWQRLAAEQNHQDSMKQIAKKDTFVNCYHAAMLENKLEQVIQLLMQEEATFAELLWDIERSSKNSLLLDTVFNIIQQLQQKGIKLDRYAAAINDLYTRKVLLDHENKMSSNKVYNECDLDSLYEMLEHITFSDVDIKHIHPLINLLIDTWYAATNLNIDKFTSTVAGYLTKIIYKLKSQKEPTLDEYSARQCATILIRHHIGKRYEVSFDGLGLQDLVMLLACIELKKSANDINQIIGKNIIKEVNFSDDAIEQVVRLLANYFKENKDEVSTSPYLSGLNRCLTKVGESLSNKREMRNVMESLLSFTLEYRSAKMNFSMFAINRDEMMERNIYRCLKKQELGNLISLLEPKANRMEFEGDAMIPTKSLVANCE